MISRLIAAVDWAFRLIERGLLGNTYVGSLAGSDSGINKGPPLPGTATSSLNGAEVLYHLIGVEDHGNNRDAGVHCVDAFDHGACSLEDSVIPCQHLSAPCPAG